MGVNWRNKILANSIKNEFDEVSIMKDIKEREEIINNYQSYGFLDKDDAIKKIQLLRISDEDIAAVTVLRFSTSSTPFSLATNDQIVGELVMQKNILCEKLIKKQMED